MPPRHQTLPPAATTSARNALQSFYCQLCSKGYSRTNDYEAHLSSYDHTHKQRLKDMKAMVRDPGAAARARRMEQKAEGGVINIKLGAGEAAGPGAGGGGFKKGGFKKTGFKAAFGSAKEEDVVAAGTVAGTGISGGGLAKGEGEVKLGVAGGESDTEDEGYEVYDPRKPTD